MDSVQDTNQPSGVSFSLGTIRESACMRLDSCLTQQLLLTETLVFETSISLKAIRDYLDCSIQAACFGVFAS